MTREDRQEALSRAYLDAVVAACGMTYSTPSKDYGIDLILNEIVQRHGRYSDSGLRVEVQLKSTTRPVPTRAGIGYDLTARAYDVMRFESPLRRVLLVLVLPADEARWVRPTRAGLVLGGRMYWASLRGMPAVRNRSSVRVVIPRRQVFTPGGLRGIICHIQAGEAL